MLYRAPRLCSGEWQVGEASTLGQQFVVWWSLQRCVEEEGRKLLGLGEWRFVHLEALEEGERTLSKRPENSPSGRWIVGTGSPY